MTFFPSRCLLCRQLLEKPGEKIVCHRCLSLVEAHRGPVCPVCGRFYHNPSASSFPCGDCLEQPPSYSRHRSFGPYSGQLKEIILLFKYRGHEGLRRPLAIMLQEVLEREGLLENVDLIIPVPLHRKREKSRGYNQAALLSSALSKLTGVPWLSDALVRTRNTPPQVSLQAAERQTNLEGAFKVKKTEKVAGRVVLLVDDVFTTGSTLRECAGELRKAGVGEVRAATLARAV
ncbi:MAG: ComF family protein [Candidatus Saccharicenans sp.]|nr:ComF family protein [Candidatus Saccharicenans sp.]